MAAPGGHRMFRPLNAEEWDAEVLLHQQGMDGVWHSTARLSGYSKSILGVVFHVDGIAVDG